MIDHENDLYHPAIDPKIDEEEFGSFDEFTFVTRAYLHHDSYSPDYVCDVYPNECMNCFGFDLNTTDNMYHLSPNVLLRSQGYPPYVSCRALY